jgi:hypothetical protein
MPANGSDLIAARAEHPPSIELRAAPRVALLLRSAKLICDEGEYICVLRDVSATGAKLKLFHAVPPIAKLRLELANGAKLPCIRVWERDGHMGVQFNEPIDVAVLISEAGAYRKRAIRLNLQLPAQVIADEAVAAMVRDLSQQGAQIECGLRLAIDQKVQLRIQGLPNLTCKIRWRRDGKLGLVFEQTFKLDEFAVLAAQLQSQQAETSNSPAQRAARTSGTR